ncbi:MAG: hypothetical protein J6C10_01805, partial [Prevotella sp.]|nr:hypothetical protein [Prevotella sp.]
MPGELGELGETAQEIKAAELMPRAWKRIKNIKKAPIFSQFFTLHSSFFIFYINFAPEKLR